MWVKLRFNWLVFERVNERYFISLFFFINSDHMQCCVREEGTVEWIVVKGMCFSFPWGDLTGAGVGLVNSMGERGHWAI